MIRYVLSKVLQVANSWPNASSQDEFYAMKRRILERFGTPCGIDIQSLDGKICHSCEGSGTFYHYSGDSDYCYRCDGSGWYKPPSYVELQRVQIGKVVFHSPLKRVYHHGDKHVPRASINGYIEHRSHNPDLVLWAHLMLGLLFDRNVAKTAWKRLVSHSRVCRFLTRRCAYCKKHLWPIRPGKHTCRTCLRIIQVGQLEARNDPPF